MCACSQPPPCDVAHIPPRAQERLRARGAGFSLSYSASAPASLVVSLCDMTSSCSRPFSNSRTHNCATSSRSADLHIFKLYKALVQLSRGFGSLGGRAWRAEVLVAECRVQGYLGPTEVPGMFFFGISSVCAPYDAPASSTPTTSTNHTRPATRVPSRPSSSDALNGSRDPGPLRRAFTVMRVLALNHYQPRCHTTLCTSGYKGTQRYAPHPHP